MQDDLVRESEVLATLIGDIYHAALDAARWGPLLGKTRDFVGGHAAADFYARHANGRTDGEVLSPVGGDVGG